MCSPGWPGTSYIDPDWLQTHQNPDAQIKGRGVCCIAGWLGLCVLHIKRIYSVLCVDLGTDDWRLSLLCEE